MNDPAKATRSKIGALPWKLRDELCRRLHDGEGGAALLDWLNSSAEFRRSGMAPISAQNLTAWRASGYDIWLNDWKKTQRLRGLAETARHIAASAGEGDIDDVALKIATGKILEMLDAADEETAEKLIFGVASLSRAATAAKSAGLSLAKFEAQEKRLAAVEGAAKDTGKTPEQKVAEIKAIFGYK